MNGTARQRITQINIELLDDAPVAVATVQVGELLLRVHVLEQLPDYLRGSLCLGHPRS